MTLIEVFADIWCPFAHVGLNALRGQLVERERGDARIWVRSWPLEWVNLRRMDPSMTLRHASELREQVAPRLFEHFDASAFPDSTIPALALAAKAYRAGERVGEALSFALREALFEQGQDLSDPDTINRIGRDFDLGPPQPEDFATVVDEWSEGKARGVRGSPHFFCGEANVFCPALDISVDHTNHTKTTSRNIERLSLFLDQCSDPV